MQPRSAYLVRKATVRRDPANVLCVHRITILTSAATRLNAHNVPKEHIVLKEQ